MATRIPPLVRCLFGAALFVSLFVAEAAAEKLPDVPAQGSTAMSEKLDAALEAPIEMEFLDTQLSDVVQFLELKQHIEIEIDAKALADAGLAPNTLLISGTLKDVPQASALDLLLSKYHLTWAIRDGILIITTPDAEPQYQLIKVYPVGDLGDDLSALASVVSESVSRDTWQLNGGISGTVAAHPTTKSLLIAQTARNHRQIAKLFEMLRTAKSAEKFGVAVPTTALEGRIEEALNRLTEMQYLDTTLADAVQDLELHHKISIEIDATSLAAAGLDLNLPLTKSLKDVPLAVALDSVLSSAGLTWVIHDDVLLITTPNAEPRYGQLKVYPVGNDDLSSLRGLLEELIEPDTWQDNGGVSGSIVTHEETHSLVVEQTTRNHRRVAKLLHDLQAGKGKKATQPEMTTRFHPIRDLDVSHQSGSRNSGPMENSHFDADARLLVDLIRQNVLPDSWKATGEEGTSIIADRLTRSLVVRQTESGHRAIEAFLDKVRGEVGVESPAPASPAPFEKR